MSPRLILASVAATCCLCLSALTSAQAAQGVSYSYDGQGRLITATYPNGTVISYSYDTAGNITQTQTTCSSSGC